VTVAILRAWCAIRCLASVHQQGPGAAPRWEFGCKAPRSWRHFLKLMYKYFVYWGFRQHLQQKKHFSTFPVGKYPYPCPLFKFPEGGQVGGGKCLLCRPCLRVPMLQLERFHQCPGLGLSHDSHNVLIVFFRNVSNVRSVYLLS